VSLSLGQSQKFANASPERLPVTRVILYKNGVAYFEHAGSVRDSQDVNVDFTTAQLNDLLKSLTVFDLGKGHITGVSYSSNAPLEKRLEAVRLPVGESPTAASFLGALRGARVEVHGGSVTANGNLLSVDEHEVVSKDGSKIKLQQLSLITEDGNVRTLDLTPSTSVRILEKDLNEEIGKYMKLIARAAIRTSGG